METTRMTWGNPKVDVQKFVPEHYCESCATFNFIFYCTIDEAYTYGEGGTNEDGTGKGGCHNHRTHYCGENVVTVTKNTDGLYLEGHENHPLEGQTAAISFNSIDGNITPANICSLVTGNGQRIDGVTWETVFGTDPDTHGPCVFHHRGYAVVQNYNYDDPSRPNHS